MSQHKRDATISLSLDIDHDLLSRLIVEQMKAQNLVVVGPPPNILLEAQQVLVLLGRAPGRPMSYPTLQKMVAQGMLTPVPGEDKRKLYFQRAEVERLIISDRWT